MTQLRIFVSTAPGVGKTTALLHLGASLARLGRRVTCIDADPARGLLRACGLAPPDAGGFSAANAVRVASTTLPGLTVLAPAAGAPPSLPDAAAGEGPPPDWILIDTAPGVPPPWTLPPGSRVVVCTDAAEEEPARVAALLADLERLRERLRTFTLDRVLFTRLDWSSRARYEAHLAWESALAPDGAWRTPLRLDRTFAVSTVLQAARLAAPVSRLGADAVRLALEWLSSTEAGEEGFQHVDALI
jgi:cellulose biosynthesis protein BcsQ